MNQQGKSIDDILAKPLNQIRFWAAKQFAKKAFSAALFDEMVNKLRPIATDPVGFETEVEKARVALATGEAPLTPDLKTPHNQMIWGGALAAVVNEPKIKDGWAVDKAKGNVTDLPLWGQVARCPDARTELRENAFILATAIKNPSTKIRWGAPDSGYPDVSYYFNPAKNMINLDLVWSLVIGIEQSRAANLHEVGHSQGTLRQPQGVQKAFAAVKELELKRRDKSLSAVDRKALNKDIAAKTMDYRMRFYIFDEAENSYANRYAVNQSTRSAQDFGAAVNNVETTLCLALHEAFSEDKPKNTGNPKPMELFSNVKSLMRYSFYVNNGMAEDTDAGWEKLGVKKDLLSGYEKDGTPMAADDVFKEVRRLCTALEAAQPQARDRLMGASFYSKKMEECCDKRCEIIDELYDRFVAHLIPEILKEQEKQQQQQQQNGQGQQGQQQEGQDGESQQSQGGGGSGGQSQQGEGQDSDGDYSDTETQQQMDEMERQMSDAVKKMMKENEAEQDNQDQKGGKGDKDGNKGDDQDKSDGSSGGQGDDDKADNKSKEENENGEEKNAGKSDKDADKSDGKDADDKNKDEGETLDDLVNNKNDASNTQTSANDGQSKPSQSNSSQNDNQADKDWNPNSKSGNDKKSPRNLTEFLPQELREVNEYNEIIRDHHQTAKRLKSQLIRMQNTYLGKEVDSKCRQLVPEDDDLAKFDVDSYVERRKKLATGQEVDERDFEHFKVKGEREKTAAPIDIAILIDRSGSMGKGKGSKLETALATACVLFESARKNPFFNVYIAAAGDPQSLSIAEPGQSEIDIARRIATVRDKCGGCQDMMADAIEKTMEKIKGNKKQDYSGATHFFVISDGNFNDEAQSVPMIETICKNAKNNNITFNMILTEKNRNKIENLADQMSSGIGSQRIDRVHISGPKDIETALSAMLNRRMVEMNKIDAQSNARKAKDFGRILDTLQAQKNSGRR